MNTPALRLARPVDTWIFDLDNTLYPAIHSLFPQIDVRIRAYIASQLDVDLDSAYRLQKQYYRDYGTSLRGLMTKHGTDPHDFLAYVHDIDHSVLAADPRLDNALTALPGKKLIFTNGTRHHAEKVMDQLGVSRHFHGIFDIIDADFVPKPEIAPYRQLAQRFRLDFTRAVMIEDLERNLAPAHQLGMTTLWFRQEQHPDRPHLDDPPETVAHVDHITHDLVHWLEQVVDLPPSQPPSCEP